MRFNDLIATVLNARADGTGSQAILWRQCVDLLAQFDTADAGMAEARELAEIARTLEVLRPRIETSQKMASVVELGHRLRSARLVRILLQDEPPVVAAAMTRARLADTDWAALIPQAGPLARSVLRRRDDLGPEAQRALALFGASDLALADMREVEEVVAARQPEPEPELELTQKAADPDPAESNGSQIRRIVDRIERFTSERQRKAVAGEVAGTMAEDRAASEAIEAFTFATDAHGTITAVSGAPRAAACGLEIGSSPLDRSHGPDGQILGAFRRRSAFRDGRLAIADGPLAGRWLVNADPQFDLRSGRFTGYSGQARRHGLLEQAPQISPVASDSSGAATGAPSEETSLRQLIHELRTPLNGVMGFAEIIESQLLGPVNDSYRSMAGSIVGDVHSLVDILDDLDYANRDYGRQRAATPGRVDLASLMDSAITRYALGETGQPSILLTRSTDLPALDLAEPVAERIVMHLVRALIACLGDEVLTVRCESHGDKLALTIDRPEAMRALTAADLFDSGYDYQAMSPHAPVLGVGFALRLVRRLAEANSGAFLCRPDHFLLLLPAEHQGVDGRSRQS